MKKKQSIIFGGLISSAGILISKILGLVYVIPLNMIAGDNNMQYYGYAYTIYSYILNISIAGIPYAIATLVAKYSNEHDYKTTLLIKKLSLGLMFCIGFISMSLMVLGSGFFSELMLSEQITEESFLITKNVIIIISFALFFVPILSSYRGFYQGLKDMEVYAFSQTFEQLTRVLFLLAAGSIAVYLFNADRIYAIYFAVFSTSVASICALAHFLMHDRKHLPEIVKLADEQEIECQSDKKSIFREMILIAIPYLLVAIVGYSNDLLDLGFFAKAYEATGVLGDIAIYVYGTMFATHTAKVVSIPQILALGFSVSIIPYITVALNQRQGKELRKYILDCVHTVLYIVLPLTTCLLFFSEEIMYILFGNPEIEFVDSLTGIVHIVDQLEYESYILKWRTLDALLGTITPVFTSLMMATLCRKENILHLIVGTIVKLVLIVPCIRLFGLAGSPISNLFSYGIVILLDAIVLTRNYKVKWTSTFKMLLFMLIGCVGIGLGAFVSNILISDVVSLNRFLALIVLGCKGIFVMIIYIVITSYLHLPQMIFKIDVSALLKKVMKHDANR